MASADVWKSIEPYCAQAIGRKDWTPEQGERPEQIYYEREYKTQVIQRDRVASCLLKELETKHGGQVKVLHDVECVGIEWGEEEKEGTTGPVKLKFHRELEGNEDEDQAENEAAAANSDSSVDAFAAFTNKKPNKNTEIWTEEAAWVVGADGVRSALRAALEAKTKGKSHKERVQSVKLPERNEFVYKTLPLDLRPKYGTGPGWRPDLNYSARTKQVCKYKLILLQA